MMYFIIYETINNVNGKRYLGKHKTEIIEDGYLGSGLVLERALKKYGKNNFSRKILFLCSSEEEMNSLEKQLITKEVCSDDGYYNIALGGQGGCISLFPENPKYEEICERMSQIRLSRSKEISERVKNQYKKAKESGESTCMMGKVQSDLQRETISKLRKGVKVSEESKTKQRESLKKKFYEEGYINPLKGRARSEDFKKKIRDSHSDVSGDKNPNFGRRKYISPIGEEKMFKIGNEPEGWFLKRNK